MLSLTQTNSLASSGEEDDMLPASPESPVMADGQGAVGGSPVELTTPGAANPNAGELYESKPAMLPNNGGAQQLLPDQPASGEHQFCCTAAHGWQVQV